MMCLYWHIEIWIALSYRTRRQQIPGPLQLTSLPHFLSQSIQNSRPLFSITGSIPKRTSVQPCFFPLQTLSLDIKKETFSFPLSLYSTCFSASPSETLLKAQPMHLFPSRRGVAPRNTASPMNSTSLYETHLGLVSLTWSRSLFSLSLSADLRLSGAPASTTSSFGKHEFEEEEEEEEQDNCFKLRTRFWLFWKRKGLKRFQFGKRCVEIVWDLRRARFPATGGPEPVSGFYVALVVDHEMLLIVGDMLEDAYKRTKLLRNTDAALISRRENVIMKDYTYKTVARFGGMEREISIHLSPEKSMVVEINGDQMLRIRRLRWKFRGCERVQTEDGFSIQISWDLHDWLFGPCLELGRREETAHARFVFKFEKPVGPEYYEVKELGWGYFGKSNWSWSSSSDKGRKKSFSSMTSSMTSTSSVSSSVTEWTTTEEMEMRRGEAFSLLVYLWKRR